MRRRTSRRTRLRRRQDLAPLWPGKMAGWACDSVPIALFIAVFTGIVLSLLSSYIFTGTVPLYFVGALVGRRS